MTFDFHTDLRPAFGWWSFQELGLGATDAAAARKQTDRLKSVDYTNPDTIDAAVRDLRHDEHIACARQTGIVGSVFVILGCENQGNYAWARIFGFEDCFPGCQAQVHDDACARRRADMVLSSERLEAIVTSIEAAIGPLSEVTYILDIDLDVFSTMLGAVYKAIDGRIAD